MELDGIEHFRSRELPGIAVTQPVIRVLDLLAVLDLLVEHSVLVTDTVTVARQFQRRHRVEETGRQAPQTAVTEAGIELDFSDFLYVLSEFIQRLLELLVQAEIEHGVAEGASDQKLQREVIDALGVLAVVGLHRLHPALDHTVTRRYGSNLEPVAGGSHRRVLADRIGQVIGQRGANRILVQGVFGRLFRLTGSRGFASHCLLHS